MVIDSQCIPVLVAGPSTGVGKRGGVVQGMAIGGCTAVILRRSYGALTLRQDSVAVAGRRCG